MELNCSYPSIKTTRNYYINDRRVHIDENVNISFGFIRSDEAHGIINNSEQVLNPPLTTNQLVRNYTIDDVYSKILEIEKH